MTTDPLDATLAAWCASRREANANVAVLARSLASLPSRRRHGSGCGERWRAPVLAAGGAWFLARLAGLFLPFLVR